MKQFIKVLVLIPCLLFLVNCSKSSDNKSRLNNQCYNQNQYGQTYYNQNCYNNGNNGGYGQTQQCYGWYYYQGQPVYCGGYNCAGYTLQNQSGQSVRCQ